LVLTGLGFVPVAIGSVGIIAITNPGTGYTEAPKVTISAPTAAQGIQATAVATIDTTNHVITSINLTEVGTGYTAPITVTITGGGGSGGTAIASLISFATGLLANITVLSGGTGYTSAPTVVLTGGGGSGAAATALIQAGEVVAVIITNPGSGYTSAPAVSFTGGAGSGAIATADIQIAPNVSVASFSGRVWVAAGRTVIVSAAGSYRDFITVSATAIVLNDETLRGSIIRLFAANNFLYVFGSDSINVFSDVTVDSNGRTLFTNTVVSSSIGTKYPEAIFNYYRSVLFMNQYGVYALVGATASKISDELDGLFAKVPFGFTFITCGQVVVNNQLCAAFCFNYFATPTTPIRYIQAMFFSKKWWIASQALSTVRVLGAQTSGNLVMYGTAGTNLVQLFGDPTTTQPQVLQTALWDLGDVMRTKQAIRAGVELRTSVQAAPIGLTIDNENASTAVETLFNAIQWINDENEIVAWQNDLSVLVDWITTGYELYQTDAAQYGKYLGLTITAQLPGIVITGTQLEYILREYWHP
jgi:hypothetical protein